MALFGLFGKKDLLARARRAAAEKRWADVLMDAPRIDRSALPVEGREELDALLCQAGDSLAQINLDEGEACRRGGDRLKAAEHFRLAREQACSATLMHSAETALAQTLPQEVLKGSDSLNPPGSGDCAGTCGPATGTQESEHPGDETHFDLETQLELALSSYPPEMAGRYRQALPDFVEAVLTAHRGDDATALRLLNALPEPARDDLFHFERGTLHARRGDGEKASADLRRALEVNPANPVFFSALLETYLAANRLDDADILIRQGLDEGLERGFLLGRLAEVHARRNDLPQALETVQQALDAGHCDSRTILFAASLLEQNGRLGEAENLLQRLGAGGGCGGGGVNIALADFWVRHGKELQKALDTFNKALRQEPDNPVYLLRVAQIYLGRNWQREARPLLERLLASPGLSPQLRDEAQRLLSSY